MWLIYDILKYGKFNHASGLLKPIIPNILRPLSSDQEHLWVGNWQRHSQGLSKQTQMAKTYHVLLFGRLDESSRNWGPWLLIEFAFQTQRKEHSHHYNLSFSWGTCVPVCALAWTSKIWERTWWSLTVYMGLSENRALPNFMVYHLSVYHQVLMFSCKCSHQNGDNWGYPCIPAFLEHFMWFSSPLAGYHQGTPRA